MSTYQPVCDLCGEPMPLGEEMFKYHGYSGPCPKPPKPKPAPSEAMTTPPPAPAEAQEAVEARLERIRVRWSQAGLTSFSQDHADVAWLLSLALSASPAPPVGAEQWRPIGDAAKSERPVLLGAELPDGTWAYDVGHWATEEERRIQVGDCGGPCRCPEYDLDEPYWVGWSHEGVQPTHYRPLFPPPARRGGEV